MTNVFFTHRVSSASSNSMEIWYNSVREILDSGDNTNWTLLNKKKKVRAGLKANEIYYSLMDSLQSANFLIADVTYPSLGVGYEIGYAQNNQCKVLCLFHTTPERGIENLSPMIRGATGANFVVETYENEKDLEKILKSFLA